MNSPGNVRLHVRVSKDADGALDRACQRYRMDRGQVIEQLLRSLDDLAAMEGNDRAARDALRAREDALMAEFNFSRDQAREVIESGRG